MILSVYENGALRRTPAQPVWEEAFDIAVAGLGTAGVTAALGCCGAGLRVLGLERLHTMGGSSTVGGIWKYYLGTEGGIFEEIDRRAEELHRTDFPDREESPYRLVGGQCEYYKTMTCETMLAEVGCAVRLNTAVTGVYLEDGRVCGVRYFDAQGFHSAACRFLIDCTGDGLLALSAGCRMQTGRAITDTFQPWSNIYIYCQDGNLRFANTDSGYVSQYDPFALSRGLLDSACAGDFLRERYDDTRRFVGISALPGMREGMTLAGIQPVTLADVMAQRTADRPLFYAVSHVDDHSQDIAYGSAAYCTLMSVCCLWEQNFTVPIPAGAFISADVPGLLCAGRALAVDHDLAQAVRMKRDIHKSGEAAAALAVLALQYGCEPQDVPYEALQTRLRATGCLGDPTPVGLHGPNGRVGYETDEARLKDAMSGDAPGYAMLSAAHMPDAFTAVLESWLSADNPLLRRNSALVLAVRGSDAGREELLRLIGDRSGYVMKNGHYPPPICCAGMTAAGLLGLEAAVEPLLAAAAHPETYASMPFRYDNLIPDDEALTFQCFSHAHMALLRIAKRRPALRESILSRLDQIIFAPDFAQFTAFRDVSKQHWDMTPTIRAYQRNADRID